MQITLTQADIEAAILVHLGTKLKFEEGFTPTIELKATRGPEGFTAIIDLDDAQTGKASRQTRQKAEKPADEPKATEAAPDKAESVEQTPATETAQEAKEEPAAEQATTVADNTETVEQATDAAQPEQSGEADAAAEQGAEDGAIPEKPKSLFAGLQKPKNPV